MPSAYSSSASTSLGVPSHSPRSSWYASLYASVKMPSSTGAYRRRSQTEDTFLYVDVGGGSTELNLVRGAELIESRSFDIGTIRQLSGKVRDEERNSFGDYVRTLRSTYGTLRLVGTGGNINKLLRLGAPSERANVNSLPVESLQRVADELRQYPPEQRMQLFRLKPDRAEVIVPAADIFLLVASITEATEIIVPTKGLADGIVDSVCPILP